MNSLNLISARVIGQSPHKQQRSRSVGDAIRTSEQPPSQPKRSASQHSKLETKSYEEKDGSVVKQEEQESQADNARNEAFDEKSPLLGNSPEGAVDIKQTKRQSQAVMRMIMKALTESLKWVLSKLLAPGAYLLACFRDENGKLSALAPVRSKRRNQVSKNSAHSTTHKVESSRPTRSGQAQPQRRSGTPQTSDSEIETKIRESGEYQDREITGQGSSGDDSSPTRRSIRIKLNHEDTARQRKQKKSQRTASDVAKSGNATEEQVAAAELKSPTSPASSLRITKYPHVPTPPRPLIPRRQPSYTNYSPKQTSSLAQKTLVIDLDETLIHSLAKGGRMSSGHMVEVKLAHAANYNGVALGPQHPILYYVHKRPYCDEFLRKISKWFNLVVFTASVQEYADPVIDWLEQERKYFSARYYRQHCTFRNGAYIKDLSSVEPDLSKVMILDNSPLSYIFHEDNAIPIEGWINDPTDNDLLHLVPLLEGLQYVTDVRALLALRRGEVEATQ